MEETAVGPPLSAAPGHEPAPDIAAQVEEIHAAAADRPPLVVDLIFDARRRAREAMDDGAPPETAMLDAIAAVGLLFRTEQMLGLNLFSPIWVRGVLDTGGRSRVVAEAPMLTDGPVGKRWPLMRLSLLASMLAIPLPELASAPPAEHPVQLAGIALRVGWSSIGEYERHERMANELYQALHPALRGEADAWMGERQAPLSPREHAAWRRQLDGLTRRQADAARAEAGA